MVTIFCPRGIRPNAGGPAGYVFNLRKGLELVESDCTVVAPDSILQSDATSKRNSNFLPELRAVVHFFKLGFRIKNQFKDVDFSDLVHVHSVSDVFYLKAMMGYQGRIILTPHCPEETWREKVDALNSGLESSRSRFFMKALYSYVEKYAYNHVDGFVFPSQNAKEIYRSFPGFAQNAHKPTRYVTTGCCDRRTSLSKEELRYKFSFQADDYVVTYIGRHNRVKGYDLLVDAFSLLGDDDIHVVCAGALGEISRPKSDSWVELGYIDNANELMEACDILVVPNRSAYFDLVIIEALSHGTVVVTTEVGGTKDIAGKSEGIVCMKNISAEALAESIVEIRKRPVSELARMRESNRRLYEEECSLEAFALNYLREVSSLEAEL